MKKFLLPFSIILYSKPTEYFVDATLGNDNNTGKFGDPWQTLAQVNGFSFNPGDITRLRRNREWREDLIPPSNGTPSRPIVFSTYGSGVNPVLNGARVVTGWTSYSGNTWQATYNRDCQQVFMDDTLLTEGVDRDTLNDGEWTWLANVLYLRDDSGDPDITGVVVEAGWEYNVLTLTGRSNIIVRDLVVEKGLGWGVRINNGSMAFGNITLSNLDVFRQYNGGMIISGISGLVINNCASHDAQTNVGLYPSGVVGVANMTIQRSSFYNNAGTGIGSNPNNGALATGCIFDSNLIYNNAGGGIGCGGEDGSVYKNNVIYGNTGVGLNVNSLPGEGFSSANIVIYHNTIISDTVCIRVDDLCPGNIARNNILSTTDRCITVVTSGGGDGELDANYNQFFAPSWTTTRFSWLGNDYDTLAEWQAGSNNDDNSDDADPAFVNEVNNNYHLQAVSPCRGAGATDTGITDDFDGIVRGSPPDIGAYEYIQ